MKLDREPDDLVFHRDYSEKLKVLTTALFEEVRELKPQLILITRKFRSDLVWAFDLSHPYTKDMMHNQTIFGVRYVVAEIETDWELIK